MTFSLVARTPDAQSFGMVIASSSSSPAVAARCSHASAKVGVVASQNITDPALGPEILRALSVGATSSEALASVLAATPYAAYRQVLVLGKLGAPAVHTGGFGLGVTGVAMGENSAAAGNLLSSSDVPAAMVAAFERATGHIAARLLAAVRAAAARGGEAGPVHSAGLLVVRELSWPIVDLRVDWSESDPIAELHALWDLYGPQVDDYVRRAVNPGDAPAFGVPGDV